MEQAFSGKQTKPTVTDSGWMTVRCEQIRRPSRRQFERRSMGFGSQPCGRRSYIFRTVSIWYAKRRQRCSSFYESSTFDSYYPSHNQQVTIH